MIDSGSIWIGEQIIDGNIDLDWPGDVANRTTLRALQHLRVWLLAISCKLVKTRPFPPHPASA